MKSCVFLAALLLTVWTAVQAETVTHLNRALFACQTNGTLPEVDYELDDDELFHIDFDKKEAVPRLPDFAKFWVPNPGAPAQAEVKRQVCINNVDFFSRCHEYPPEKQDPPRAAVYPEKDLELGKPNTLICFITDFHPAAIKVTWTKNTLPVTEGVSLTQYYSNKDYTLQMFSYLSFTPELGDVYSCQVQHSALPETLTTFWEPDVQTDSDVGKTAFCAVGLTLGLLGVAVGTFFLIKGNKCN
ncbi:H-2 class II histocompatibility antigen, A-U alpha chain-like [Acipenser oxyrinchus oxyrinchus]|uniref:H-2 class II histocompatibility antigen, A-U alpha chain-like n=1 Tax=Acipenser oxyrinchus oxyrinchus TaxID=40147 RepID=A0AAD8FX30_ACIOX|nr:H-2 class II histocompatibility antigen, A-U alpha chain-like [Acipenser oxyrinchus oxyrinchus]